MTHCLPLKLQMYPADRIGSSGSMFLKMYILVFSIIANRSGLSVAHLMSHTSFRSNFMTLLPPRPEVLPPPAAEESISMNWRRPVTSTMERQLKMSKVDNDLCVGVKNAMFGTFHCVEPRINNATNPHNHPGLPPDQGAISGCD